MAKKIICLLAAVAATGVASMLDAQERIQSDKGRGGDADGSR